MKTVRLFTAALCAFAVLCACSCRKTPVIGISSGISESGTNTLHSTYVQAVVRAGGIPVIVPVLTDSSAVEAVISRLDGIVFSGGEDFDPALYGQEIIEDADVQVNAVRDSSDLLYARSALRRGLPVLGICRGCQLMNVAAGGTLYQDLPTQMSSDINHRDRECPNVAVHQIVVERGGFLYKLFRTDTLGVNSLHHQAVRDLAPIYELSAVATDGVTEAFENKTVYAVQFHPEKLLAGGDDSWLKLFKSFLNRCK